MKNLLFLFLAFGILLACESEDRIITEDLVATPPLVGEWQLVEQKVSIGGPATWQDIEDGDTFTLNADGTFDGFQLFSDCKTGTFESTDEELTLTYNCDDDTKPFTYSLRKENEDIIISPKTVICTETCEYKYRKID